MHILVDIDMVTQVFFTIHIKYGCILIYLKDKQILFNYLSFNILSTIILINNIRKINSNISKY